MMWKMWFSCWLIALAGVQAFPTFDDLETLSTSETSIRAIARGDLDGDGREDIVYVASLVNRVGWFRNLGDHFGPRIIISPSASGVSAVDVADVDGDGDLDVVVASTGNDRVSLFKNTNGAGTTWSAVTISPILDPQVIAFADLNTDGAVDIVTTDDDRLVWLNNSTGDGSTWVPTDISTNVIPVVVDLVIDDLDHDGHLDVISASSGGPVSLHINSNGDGSQWLNQAIVPGAFATDIDLADINRDGLIDLIVPMVQLDTLVWLPNLGAHSFGIASNIASNLDGLQAVESGDLDHDGWVDVVAGLTTTRKVVAFPGTTNLTFATAITIEDTLRDDWRILLMDFDEDGDDDIFVSSTTDGDLGFSLNELMHRQAAAFCDDQPVGSVVDASTVYTAAADLINSGAPDLLTLEDGGATLVSHLNYFPERFDRVVLKSGLVGATHLELVDMDQDGALDIITHTFDSLDERLLMVHGRTMVTTELNTTRYGASAFTVGDVDRDGDIDIVAGSDVANNIRWFVNTGAPGVPMAPVTIVTGVTDPQDIEIGDLDGDGLMDVVVSSGSQNRLTWYRQTPTTTWQSRTISSTVDNPTEHALVDMDNDGDLDVVLSSDDGLVWYENLLGSGTTWATHTLSTKASGRHMRVCDADQDGDFDLVTILPGDGQIYLYENVSMDNWEEHALTQGPGEHRSLAVADVSRKGHPGIVYTKDATIRFLDACVRHATLSSIPLAPLSGPVSTSVELLRIDYTHEGRAGDLDLALNEIRVRPSHGALPFSSRVEFDQTVAALEVWRDDGSGRLDSGDVLVGSRSAFISFDPITIDMFNVPQRLIAPGETVGFILAAAAEPLAYLAPDRHFRLERLEAPPGNEITSSKTGGEALQISGTTVHSGDLLWSAILLVTGDITYNGVFNSGPFHLGAVVGQALNRVLRLTNPGARVGVQGNTTALEPGAGPWSIAAWVITEDASQTQAIAGKQRTTGVNDGWLFGISHEAGTRQLFLELRTSASSELIRVASPTLANDTWYHLAASWDGGTTEESIRLYINGVEVASTGTGGTLTPPVSNAVAMKLGASGDAPRYFLKGRLDEVTIWNLVLPLATIQAMYQQGVDPLSPGLSGFWNFDDETPDDAIAGRIGSLENLAHFVQENRTPARMESLSGFGGYDAILPGDFSYTFFAWVDANQNGRHDAWEPSGVHTNRIDLAFADRPNVDITFTDTFDVDSDGDGVPDFYEFLWFNDTIAGVAGDDFDMDGYTVLEEFIMDSSPLDRLDFLRILDVVTSTNQPPNILFRSSNSRRYTLQSTPTPADTNSWTDVDGWVRVPGLGLPTQALEGIDSPSNRLYRVLVELP
ncbi:MAG: hypothetical protein ACI97B_001009 [Verrucomicrobiales bacterium]|jgi:hypothetical protein